ncbi:uncharacterized protein LOC131843607 [Achroia grisella]|uniref:uncharacterized protein LOC131843607 n=1 Tax=Achroia grisella TaxID=688607 RepID=UPI0027D2B847|nr:uncharacterized protein LOC131843607 [Achroia grisella]
MSEQSSTLKSRSKSPCKISITGDDNTNQLIRDLVKKRSIIKGRFTRFQNFINTFEINSNLSRQTKADLRLRIQNAANLFSEFNDLQSKLEELVLEADLDEQIELRGQFEDSYFNTLSQAECMLSGEDDASYSKSCPNSNDSLKLPVISVPTFTGLSDQWLQYRDIFLSLVHNNTNISSIQKFHYLKSSLKGTAALVIDLLEFSANNYSVAWELLLNRFNNSRLLIHNHVKALFTLQTVTKESPDQLRYLIDNILKNLRALKLLGEPVDSWDTLIIYIIVSKLDKISEREWEQYKITVLKLSADSESRLTVDTLLAFLKDRADMLETLLASHNNYKTDLNHKQISNTVKHNVHSNVSSNKPQIHTKRSCLFCDNGYHPLYACQTFISTDLDSRLKFVSENKLCDNCLRPGHRPNECRFGGCRKCNKKHNSLIHKDSEVCNLSPISERNTAALSMHSSFTEAGGRSAAAVIGPDLNINKCSRSSTHTNTLCAQYPCTQPVLLSTALVDIYDKYNNIHSVRALLDSGSERCIMTQSLCDILDLPIIQSTQEIRGVGNSITQSTKMCDIELKSRISSYTACIRCIVLPHITSTLPAIPKQYAQFRIPDSVQLADPYFCESQSIDILIGADKFWNLLSSGRMRLPNGPFLQNTRLGWIISGSVGVNTQNTGHIQCNFTHVTDTQSQQFKDLEKVTKSCETQTDDQRECENPFITTTMRNNDGRFCIRIPLKSSPHELGESYPQTLNRFSSLEAIAKS